MTQDMYGVGQMTLISAALSRAFPTGVTRYRKVKFGLAKGCCLPIDLTGQLRLLFGVYEPEIAGRVASYVSRTSCCYDIGAAIGYYTLAFAQLAPEGSVYAFEMDKSLCEQLSVTLQRNVGLRPNVHIINGLVARYGDEKRGLVNIDELVFGRQIEPPSLIKMDVEGAEADVLAGSSEVLRQFHPGLVVETHSLEVENQCIEQLVALDYEVEVIRRNRILLENRPIEHNQWICAS
jgi:precorrin-6B methylase 2